jgi:hypothetical protein
MIPYTSYPSSETNAVFHPALWQAACHRIRPQLFKVFGTSAENHKFLHLLLTGVLKHPRTHESYEIVLESFGVPLFRIRNLAHTLQDPVDRMVYVIHLEESLHAWRIIRDDSVCWEAWVAMGVACLVGIGMAFFLKSAIPTPIPYHLA